jgi:hypothetical protein
MRVVRVIPRDSGHRPGVFCALGPWCAIARRGPPGGRWPVRHSYTAPGNGHTILENETFYEVEVNGVTLVDWVDALISGEPLDDVDCDQCETA